MKNKLYIFTAILVSLFSLTSCGLEEPYTPEKNPDAVIEFVGRPVGFNNQDVDTKSAASGIENTVNACYFLLFDATTGGILYRTGGDAGSLQNFRIPKTELAAKGITSVTACYLVNVPKTFAEGLKYLEKTSSAASGKNPGDNECLSTAVIDIPSYQSGTPMGVPVIDGKAGIPMYGKATFSLEGNTNTEICQIPVKRLFAKITVDISLALSLEGWGEQIIQSATYYKLDKYTLHNLPKKVCLEEKIQETESAWAGVKSSFAYTDAGSNPSGSLNQSIVYNNNGNYSFSFYVPEYYLNASTKADENQKNKPKYYRDGGLPVYITLHGSYIEYTYRSAKMQHKIYLGRDSHSDFSFARNTHYTNYLTINGISGNEKGEGDNLDWRVVADVIHNPVEVEGKSANCYIIKDSGDYSFPAYKGAYNELKEAKFCSGNGKSQVVLVARDNDNIQLSNMKYDAASNFISFTVSNIADGNAVIALQNEDGSIEWSWHLWCNSSSIMGDWIGNMTGWGDMSYQAYPNGSKMMDRNLGASSTSSALSEGIGLYYQYGNKNPFIKNGYKGGGVNGEATWYMEEYDQNGNLKTKKAIHDPCPPGYRVPSLDVWSTPTGSYPSHVTLDATGWLSNGVLQLYSGIYCPYSGYRYSDTSDPDITSTDIREFEVKDSFIGSLGLTATFRNVKFKASVTLDTGYLLTRNVNKDSAPHFLKYGYYNVGISDLANNFELISCDYRPGLSWKNNQTSLSTGYLNALKAGLALRSGNRSGYDFITTEVGSRGYGYQVRCVSEESTIQ